MALELESLRKAISALARSLRVVGEQAGGEDVDLQEAHMLLGSLFCYFAFA